MTHPDAPRLGSLDWLPADEHPDLLAPPVAAALGTLPGSAWVARIDDDLADTAAFTEAYSVPPEVSANCVVVAARRAGVTTLAACLVLATTRADVNGLVRRHLDARKASFAPQDVAVAESGMAYGGITPIGLPEGWPVLVDAAVAAAGWVVVGSGHPGEQARAVPAGSSLLCRAPRCSTASDSHCLRTPPLVRRRFLRQRSARPTTSTSAGVNGRPPPTTTGATWRTGHRTGAATDPPAQS